MAIEAILRGAVSWLHVLVSLAGLGVCVLHLQRSRFMLLPAAGFGLQAAVTVGYQAAAFLIGRFSGGIATFQALTLGLSFLGALASLAIVGGFAAVLWDPNLDAGGAPRA